jgi:hypothetical protein
MSYGPCDFMDDVLAVMARCAVIDSTACDVDDGVRVQAVLDALEAALRQCRPEPGAVHTEEYGRDHRAAFIGRSSDGRMFAPDDDGATPLYEVASP